jgi:ATP-dependent Clp protease ATP-binding subunit ClpA
MFERYTEKARRVIFFARYEASQTGGSTIETEHLLLGLLRKDPNLVRRFLRPDDSNDAVRLDIQKLAPEDRSRTSTSVELPLSIECKRILAYAAEEAERLRHRHIGTEHLLVGIFRETDCLAARILRDHGFHLTRLRDTVSFGQLIGFEKAGAKFIPIDWPPAGIVPDEATAICIAEAIWIPVFGRDRVEQQRPVRVDPHEDSWVVRGNPSKDAEHVALTVTIDKRDGRILWVGLESQIE